MNSGVGSPITALSDSPPRGEGSGARSEATRRSWLGSLGDPLPTPPTCAKPAAKLRCPPHTGEGTLTAASECLRVRCRLPDAQRQRPPPCVHWLGTVSPLQEQFGRLVELRRRRNGKVERVRVARDDIEDRGDGNRIVERLTANARVEHLAGIGG